jgi:hypothetical protein
LRIDRIDASDVEIARVEPGDISVHQIPYPAYLSLRESAATLSGVYGYELNLKPVSLRADGSSERAFASFVTTSYFEVLGVKRAIFIKDEDGLYTDDPKKDPKATHIPRITSKQLIERHLPDVVIERIVVEYLPRAQWCKELQIVNGLKPGNVLAALKGEDVGTIISA